MKLIDLKSIPFNKVEDRKELFHRTIVGEETGAKHFEFIQSSMGKGGMGKLHSHPHSEHIIIVTKGKLQLSNAKESHVVSVDQGLFLVPGEEHEVLNINDDTTEYFVIYAPPR